MEKLFGKVSDFQKAVAEATKRRGLAGATWVSYAKVGRKKTV